MGLIPQFRGDQPASKFLMSVAFFDNKIKSG